MRGTTSAHLLFDPEIERTARANRKATRTRRRRERRARATREETVPETPVVEEMGDQPIRRTLGDYGNTERNRQRLPIAHQPVTVNKFEINPGLFRELREMQFGGRQTEDANKHLTNFMELCETVKVDGNTDEAKKLRLFPFSLKDEAKEWLNSLPQGSITTWNDLEDKFLQQFFPPSMFVKRRGELTNFLQKEGESLHEAYKRFKIIVKACPNHGLDDHQQMQILCNGLRPNSRIMLDAAAGGSLNFKTSEEAREIVEAMASNDYLASHDRGGTSKKGLFDLDSHDAGLAQQKIITQQLDELKKGMEALKLNSVQHQAAQVNSVKGMKCDFCEGPHPNGACELPLEIQEQVNFVKNNPYSNTYNPGWRNHPNFSWKDQGQSQSGPPKKADWEIAIEKLATQTSSFMEETRAGFKTQEACSRNQEASIRNLETQVGQLAKQIAQRPPGSLPSDTIPNPKGNETANAITTRSGKVLEAVEKKSPEEVIESNSETPPVVVEESVLVQEELKLPKPIIKLPFPQRLKKEQSEKQFGKFLDVFKKLQINIPFAEALEQMPTYAKFMKEILSKKRRIVDDESVMLTEECSAILQRKLPQKLKDPGSFSIPCTIGDRTFGKALCDLGASISLMPLSIFKRLGIGQIKNTMMTLHFADRSVKHPYGIVEDVLVKIDKFIFPVDFVVLDMEEDSDIPLILGRPFLATGRALIDVADGTLTLNVQDEKVTFNVLKAMEHPKGEEGCYRIEILDSIVNRSFQE